MYLVRDFAVPDPDRLRYGDQSTDYYQTTDERDYHCAYKSYNPFNHHARPYYQPWVSALS